MPIYDYVREDGTHFDYKQGMNDEALTECPETGQSCRRWITGGQGPQLPFENNIKYVDGNFINTNAAKRLEKNPFYTTLEDKRERINAITEKNVQAKAEAYRKITGRISEI